MRPSDSNELDLVTVTAPPYTSPGLTNIIRLPTPRPIRGQYPGHVMPLDQSEVSMVRLPTLPPAGGHFSLNFWFLLSLNSNYPALSNVSLAPDPQKVIT